MRTLLTKSALLFIVMTLPIAAMAATTTDASVSPVAVAVRISGSSVSYGDLIDFNKADGIYTLSQKPDDPNVFGVAVQNPPMVFFPSSSNNVPVAQSGTVLVNVTLQNGAIRPGDELEASSIPGKAMLAASSSAHNIGIAQEAFPGTGSTTMLILGGKTVPAGTIAVQINTTLGQQPTPTAEASQQQACTEGRVACNLLQKINAAPLVTLMRYVIAAIVACGALYLAFRSFMADAINGVVSVGRNPRAKGAIQAMVVFNAVLAGVIAFAGLGVGVLILLIQV